MILTPAAAIVKPAPAAETFPLGYATQIDLLERDARDMAGLSTEDDEAAAWDAHWDAMDEATMERMADEAAFADRYESGEMPW